MDPNVDLIWKCDNLIVIMRNNSYFVRNQLYELIYKAPDDQLTVVKRGEGDGRGQRLCLTYFAVTLNFPTLTFFLKSHSWKNNSYYSIINVMLPGREFTQMSIGVHYRDCPYLINLMCEYSTIPENEQTNLLQLNSLSRSSTSEENSVLIIRSRRFLRVSKVVSRNLVYLLTI